VVVLGNHDLSLLAVGARTEEEQRKVNLDLLRIVQAEDRDELLDWLRLQKLVHVDRELGWMMVARRPGAEVDHADGRKACRRGRGAQLHGAGYRKLFRNMYGDKPSWAPNLSGYDRRARSSTCSPACATAPAQAHRHRGQGARRARRNRGCIPGSKCRAGSSATSRSSAATGRRWA
jgi:hypothetical protein